MSSHPFAFPPPPPAPPKASQSYPGVAQPFAGPNGYRGSEDSRDYGNRGHGRGFNRGGRRGGHFSSSKSNSGYGNPPLGIGKMHSSPPDMGYNDQANDYKRSGYPPPSYPPIQLPHFPANVHRSFGPQNPAFPAIVRPAQAAHLAHGDGAYQIYDGQHQYSSPTMQAPLPSPQNNNTFQTTAHASQPVLMGPPIRMGFNTQRDSGQTQQHAQPTTYGTNAFRHGLPNGNESPYRHSSSIGFRSGRHESPNTLTRDRGRGQKRGFGEIHNRPRNQNQRVHVAPAVPSFGSPLPLPSKPPALHGNTRKPRKKKRKHNQLGLTPKAEQHESSEEEDDTDEEATLAAVAASAGQGHQLLQFDYKGRTSTLQSSSDITAWIEERKKRFPTKARAAEIAESKLQRKNQQGATDQVPGEAQIKHETEIQKRKRRKAEGEKQQKKGKDASEETAAKSKRKVEKLRKQLEKEERRIAKAEARASKDEVESSAEAVRTDVSPLGSGNKKRKRSDSSGSGNAKVEDTDSEKPKLREAASIVPHPLTPTSEPALADEEQDSPPKFRNADDGLRQMNSSTGQEGDGPRFPDVDRSIHDSSASQSDSSSDSSSIESEEDDTSSSGSSSDGDSDGVAPDEAPTKRDGPERVSPPKHAKPKQICRAFLHKGLCKRGSSCKYLHELPGRGGRGAGSEDVRRSEGKRERVGLYQRLVEQEKEQEDHTILEAILHLGEKGLLEKGMQVAIREEVAS